MAIRQKRVFSKVLDCLPGDELLIKENYGQLVLCNFCIFNIGENDIKIKINNSDEEILLEPNEGFDMGEYETFSCVAVTSGMVKFSGIY